MGRKYYHKRKNAGQEGIDLVTGLIILIGLAAIGMIQRLLSFISTHQQEVRLYSYVVLGVIGIALVIIGFFWIRNRKKKTELLEGLIGDIVAEISEFKPLKRYREELPYQMELAGYLRKTFPTLAIEESKGGTRPDIIVEDIAIEIKGPTGNGELRTIADKIIRYLKHYDKLIVVLFTLEVPDRQYSEWKEDIHSTFESKKDKLFILDI